jgi:hypothetical protein
MKLPPTLMKIVVDGERTRLEFYVDGKFYRRWVKGNWRKWAGSRSVSVTTPLFYLDIGADFWLVDIDNSEPPKYSRPKRLTLTVEHGLVKGYKE